MLLLIWFALPLAASSEPSDAEQVVAGAHLQIGVTIHYDPSYQRLTFPLGDVPADRGVCTDVVIRALRHAGIDLQVEVHRDMRASFASYPALWGLSQPDPNIDHRRVPNLERYFERRGLTRRPSSDAADYLAGDLVSWRLPNGLPHIGVVSDQRSGERPLVVHNIGAGTQLEDVLFAWPVHGHFRLASTVPTAIMPRAVSSVGRAADF